MMTHTHHLELIPLHLTASATDNFIMMLIRMRVCSVTASHHTNLHLNVSAELPWNGCAKL